MADFLAPFEAEAKDRLARALEQLHPGAEPAFIMAPAPPGQGDLAAGCFPLAKPLKSNPAAIATQIAQTMTADLDGTGWVVSAEAAGPYINLRIHPTRLATAVVESAQTDAATFGMLEPRAERVILEHTSANPNGPLHVGRARNPIIGDTLVRVHRAAGFDVEAQYYVDDMGKQVAILTWGIENLSEEDVTKEVGPALREKVDHDLVRYYQAANARMEADENVRTAIHDLIRITENGDEEALARVDKGYMGVFEGMLSSLKRLGVSFDSFIKESTFVSNGDTDGVVQGLLEQNRIPVGEEGEARYLDLAGEGVTGRSTKFFFRRSDGTSLYATRDVAYHMWKARQADRLVNVLGEDHKLQAKQVRTCLDVLEAPHLPEVVFYSFVSLPEGKMSTRRNRVVFIDDLLDEAVERAYQEVLKRREGDLDEATMRQIAEDVGVGAVRFAIIKVQCEKPITFRWEDALAFEGFASPFIQYSHARVAGILDKARTANLGPSSDALDLLEHPSELALVMTLARLPGVVREAALKQRPHNIAQYAYDVADAFNQFYRDCRVIDVEPALAGARLALVEATRVALVQSLGLLGIAAPDQM